MEKSELKSAVKEFNKVIELENPVSMKSETVEKDLYDGLSVIEPEDKFSDATLKVFAEIRKQFDKSKKEKPVETKSKTKDEKKTTVKAGTTVEMDADTDDVKIEKSKMKKEKEAGKPAKGEAPEVKIIKTILDRKVGKEALTELIKNQECFSDKKLKKALLAESNFMSLKKKMLDVFDEELVKKYRAELPPIDHTPKAKPEAKVVENPVVNGIKSATKVKQLKKIAKANDQFNWKKLKKLEDFEEIQSAMLKTFGQGKEKSKPEAPKVKMVPNPLIAEIEAFEKRKKLYKWAEEHDAFEKLFEDDDDDELEDLDVDELKEKLISSIPAKVEEKGGKTAKAKAPRNEAVAEERREFLIPLLKEGKYGRTELLAMLNDKFGKDDPKGAHPHNNMLSEMKNPKYYAKHGLGKLVEESKSGKYRFVK